MKKNKLWFLTKYSLDKKIKTKWFLIANLIILIVLLLGANINTIITAVGGDFLDKEEIILVNNNEIDTEKISSYIDEFSKSFGVEEKYEIIVKEEEDVDFSLTEEDTSIIIKVVPNEEEYLKVEITSFEAMTLMNRNILNSALTSYKSEYAIEKSGISPDEINAIISPVNIDEMVLSDKSSQEESLNEFYSEIVPLLMMPSFILTVLVVQMIGAEINEEKTSKSMEIIISNVSAKTHFASKIIAANLFAVIQSLLMISFSFIAYLSTKLFGSGALSLQGVITNLTGVAVDSSTLSQFWYFVPYFIIMSLLSILAFSLIAGILAAMTVNMEDYQQVQTPIMLIMLAGFYLTIFSSLFEGSTFIKAISLVPLLSSFLAPSLLIVGQITIVQSIISLVVLLLFILILVKYGIKIYKVGILNYSTDKMWSKIFKAAKKSS